MSITSSDAAESCPVYTPLSVTGFISDVEGMTINRSTEDRRDCSSRWYPQITEASAERLRRVRAKYAYATGGVGSLVFYSVMHPLWKTPLADR